MAQGSRCHFFNIVLYIAAKSRHSRAPSVIRPPCFTKLKDRRAPDKVQGFILSRISYSRQEPSCVFRSATRRVPYYDGTSVPHRGNQVSGRVQATWPSQLSHQNFSCRLPSTKLSAKQYQICHGSIPDPDKTLSFPRACGRDDDTLLFTFNSISVGKAWRLAGNGCSKSVDTTPVTWQG